MSAIAFLRELLDAGLDLEGALIAAEKFESRTCPPEPTGRLGWFDAAYLRDQVLKRDGLVCGYCHEVDGPFEVDHIKPLARGGGHEMDNLIVACRTCNRSKGAKTLEEWVGRRC